MSPSLICGAGAPDIAATALAVRRTPSRIFARVFSSSVRMVPRSVASSGMMLPALPELTEPTVTTPNDIGSFSRLITVCTSSMKRAAITTGSMDFSGMEPCAPRPMKVISIESAVVS